MHLFHRLSMALSALLLCCTLQAQDRFPQRPLTLVVPYPSGGAADVIARALALELGKRLGQAVVIDNRAGANGNIGSAWVARQQPADGYTLLLGSASTLAINPHLYKSMGYDPVKDLQPLSLTHKMPNVLLVGASTPYKTVADVVAAAKARPGTLAFGSAGNGNTMHLAGVIFQEKSSTQLVHVPYKGGPPALNDVLAGQIPMMFNNLPAVVPVHNAGKVRALAVADTQRSPLMPQTPTMAEAGFPGVVSVVWNGLLVRRGTPAAIVERLSSSLRAVLASPEFRAPIEAQGYDVLSSSPEEFEALIQQDLAAMALTIQRADIRLD
jgi:tripartite-type tricarboxylate transporter receptor subunit TctC